MGEQADKSLDRREFLSRTGKAGLSIAAGAGIYYLLYDNKGPSGRESKELVTLRDFSVPYKAGEVMSVVKGADRVKSIDKAIELIGGIERFVKAGETVVIKPNAAFATPSILGATANPELVAEVVRLCYSGGGAKQVYVTDNPINDAASCFRLSGIGKAAEAAGAKVLLPRSYDFKPTTVKGGKHIREWPIFFGPFEKADKVIGISPVKSHHRSGASMSMKNWYGLLGGRRNIFHQDINGIISELSVMVRPSLVILDGVEVMMTNGPTGGSLSDLRRADTLIASCDMVAADSYGCGLLDLRISNLPYLAKAEAAGAGVTDYKSLGVKFATLN